MALDIRELQFPFKVDFAEITRLKSGSHHRPLAIAALGCKTIACDGHSDSLRFFKVDVCLQGTQIWFDCA